MYLSLYSVLITKPKQCPPRPIPRPNRKRFLASVLTILSKSTAGTQCPDGMDRLRKMDKRKSKPEKKRDDDITREVSVTTPSLSKKKPRYRSKVLKNNIGNEAEPILVLQSTKDVAQTPSNNSQCITARNSVNTYVDPKTLRWGENLPPPTASDGKNFRHVDKELTNKIENASKRVDKSSCNYFVDVIKTSFSVYNVKTEFNKNLPHSAESSKVALEINESVAEKLYNMQNIKDTEFKETNDVTKKPSSKYFYSIQPESQDWDDKQLLDHFQSEFTEQYNMNSPKGRQKIKSESFNYKKKPLPNTTSFPSTKRKTQKSDRKKNFINSLKEELQMKDYTYKEPENFYQALKVIAKNKRRYQKAIHFRSLQESSEGDVHECQFKRRKVLSEKPNAKQSNHYPETRFNPLTLNPNLKTRFKKRKIIADREKKGDESEHSLEVVGYDYEIKKTKVQDQSSLELRSRAPSPMTLIEDYKGSLLMDYSESGTSNMMPIAVRQSSQFKHLYSKLARF